MIITFRLRTYETENESSESPTLLPDCDPIEEIPEKLNESTTSEDTSSPSIFLEIEMRFKYIAFPQ